MLYERTRGQAYTYMCIFIQIRSGLIRSDRVRPRDPTPHPTHVTLYECVYCAYTLLCTANVRLQYMYTAVTDYFRGHAHPTRRTLFCEYSALSNRVISQLSVSVYCILLKYSVRVTQKGENYSRVSIALLRAEGITLGMYRFAVCYSLCLHWLRAFFPRRLFCPE